MSVRIYWPHTKISSSFYFYIHTQYFSFLSVKSYWPQSTLMHSPIKFLRSLVVRRCRIVTWYVCTCIILPRRNFRNLYIHFPFDLHDYCYKFLSCFRYFQEFFLWLYFDFFKPSCAYGPPSPGRRRNVLQKKGERQNGRIIFITSYILHHFNHYRVPVCPVLHPHQSAGRWEIGECDCLRILFIYVII